MNEKKEIVSLFVDLETASRKENAAILSIGATDFVRADKIFSQVKPDWREIGNITSYASLEEMRLTVASKKENSLPVVSSIYKHKPTTFYERISLTSCFLRGMHFEEETQKWWMQQNAEARSELMFNDSKDVTTVLQSFIDYCNTLTNNGEKELVFWSQGTDFDARILGHAIENVLGVPRPWKYNMVRDARTYVLENNISYEDIPQTDGLVKHNALHDAIRGAMSVIYTDIMK